MSGLRRQHFPLRRDALMERDELECDEGGRALHSTSRPTAGCRLSVLTMQAKALVQVRGAGALRECLRKVA